MLINVLDKDLTKIAIVDTFTSLMWCKRYYEAGALDLQIEATRQNLELFTDGRFITRDDDETVYVIRAVQLETKENRDNSLIVGAVDCKSILNQRIIWGIINYSGTVENYIRKLVTDNIISPALRERRIPNFTLGDMVGFPETIKQQASYVNVGEKISELCKTYDIGCTVSLDDNGMFVLDMYRGVNRSQSQREVNPLIFSPEFDNLVSSKYEVDSTKYKNACLVGGEGEGKDRKTLAVGSAFGIERHEIFVDQKSSSSNTEETISEADYYESLRSKGEGELAKLAVKAEFEGEVVSDSYKYKVDYNLGDTVTVMNEYGITADAKIVEIVETWDSEGYTLEPIFEFSEVKELIPTEEGALLSENGAMLMTTRSRAIVAEQPEEYTDGVRISDLEPVTELYGGCCFPIVQDGETKRVTIDTLADSLGIDEIQNDITALKNGFAKKSITLPQGSSIWVLFHKQNYNKDVLVEVCAKLDGGDLQSAFNCRFFGSMYTYKHACVYDYLGLGVAKITVYPVKISNNGKWNGSSAYGVELKNNFTDNNTKILSIISIKINGVAVDPSNHVSVYSSKPTYMTKGSQCTANTANGVIYLN